MRIPGMWTYDKNGYKPVTLWMIIAAKLRHWFKA